ncbi:hypothetical protein L3X38_035329 [Prunus dulcis]|uniref:KRR-R motif-containing protein 1 n=1 Tax=Prunus dulcis TaxID=3755 RepID=A0AAD4VJH7_PRUDU|nr:hypothetical protein L3X38_035329 [Prunus dulcis]
MNNSNVNGAAKQRDKYIVLFDKDDEDITMIPEEKFLSFRRPFCRSDATYVQESWPAFESALKEVPIHQALRILKGPYDIIRTGHHVNGICTKYRITRDIYHNRKKRLMNIPVKELEELIGCEIYMRPKNDLVVAIGGSDQELKLVRQIVSACIERTVPHSVKGLRDYLKMFLGIKKLSL